MTYFSRRSVLQLFGVGILMGGGGCLSTFSSSETSDHSVHICDVVVMNRDEQPHSVSVRVIENEEVLIEKNDEVPAYEGERFDSVSLDGADLEYATGQFTIEVELADSEPDKLYLPDHATDQIGVLAMIYPDPPSVSFSVSADENLNSCS